MFETQGGARNRTRDLPKKGSAFITSSDHWTKESKGAGKPQKTESYTQTNIPQKRDNLQLTKHLSICNWDHD